MRTSSRRSSRVLLAAAAGVCLAAAGCAAPLHRRVPPRLVVVIVMDMLPAGTLERIRPLLTGGLGTLLEDGRSFANCEHRHASTMTGPGHATLLSGLHPRHHGVILNEWFDRTTGAAVYCAGGDPADPGPEAHGPGKTGVSPANLRGQNLPDALRRAYPDARIFAVAGKDRSAVLPAGHAADGAFWFDHATGGFTGNLREEGELPAWGRPFWGGSVLDSEPYRASIPARWEYPVRPEADADDRPAEQARYSRITPHPLMEGTPSDTRTVADRIYHSPWLNWLVLDLAGRLVEAESMGTDATPDLLVLGLSGGDPAGHYYGPASQEYLDILLRTDAWLGEFMRTTRRMVEAAGGGPGGVVWALSSDHGVLPLPETVEGGRRIDRAGLGEELERTLAEALGGETGPYIAHISSSHVYLDEQALGRAGVGLGEAARVASEAWAGLDGVERVFTAEQLRTPSAGGGTDLYLELYRNSYDPERGGDLVIQPCPRCLITSRPWETTHGSPYDYDRRVPMIIMGDGIDPGEDPSACRTVDLAPTLAGLLGLAFDNPRDGRSLLAGVDRSPAEP